MGIVYILIGFLLGTYPSRVHHRQKRTSRNDKDDIHTETDTVSEDKSENKNRKKVKIRKKMKKYFALKNDSPDEVDPSKIKVNIQKKTPERNKSSPEPNFIALTILWAHFVANQLGLLNEDKPAPWRLLNNKGKSDNKTEIDISQNSWRNFLANIIKDRGWTRWIKDPNEVKNRTLLAFNN